MRYLGKLSQVLMNRSRSVSSLLLLALAYHFISPSSARAYTPESPEVQRMVERAVKYLTSPDRFYDEEHRALAAMALYKAGEQATHPLIQEAAKECKDICRSSETVERVLSIYGTAVVGLFLSELDPKQYENEIANVVKSLEKQQKSFGGWGYPAPHEFEKFGDTSMTQYAVLCSWLTRNTGAAQVSQDSVRQVTNWLIRTQDPSGAWSYQGRDPGATTFTKRIAQDPKEIRHSLVAAAMGSLYICSNMLGFTAADGLIVTDDSLPPALKPIMSAPSQRQPDANVDKTLLRRAMRDGDRWYTANYRINPSDYTMYYLYTLERYQSFKELAEGRVPKQPRWYNDGVRYLQKTQERDGSWNIPNGTSTLADTTFGIFFLVRSTKKSIAKTVDEYDGLLVAGRGLPSNTENVRMKRGQIVTTPFQGTANALLEILNNQDHPDFESASNAEAIKLSSNPKEAEEQQKRLRRLVRAESYLARSVAVKTLSSVRNLDNVPALIYSLSDPDMRIVLEARDGLRFISRKFNGVGMDDVPSTKEKQAAIKAWTTWYLTIRPDAYIPK